MKPSLRITWFLAVLLVLRRKCCKHWARKSEARIESLVYCSNINIIYRYSPSSLQSVTINTQLFIQGRAGVPHQLCNISNLHTKTHRHTQKHKHKHTHKHTHTHKQTLSHTDTPTLHINKHTHLCTNLHGILLVVKNYHMSLISKFHKDPSFSWGDIALLVTLYNLRD